MWSSCKRSRIGALAWLLFVLVQLACGGPGPRPPQTAARIPSATPAAVPSVASTPPTEVADFSCQLPLSGIGDVRAGFLSFPAGDYRSEPADRLPTQEFRPDLGVSYDRQLQRWLPVRREQVSPDGRAYAYVDFPNREDGQVVSDGVHIIDAATGQERRVIPNRPRPALPWFVLGFEARALYLAGREPWSGGHARSLAIGLSVADPTSGRVSTITEAGSWSYVGVGAAWGMDSPRGRQSDGVGSKLVRLDLSTGAQEVWLTRDVDLQLVGIDRSGHPLVELNSESAGRPIDHPGLWLVQAPDQLVALQPLPGLNPPELDDAGTVLEDAHGIWITPGAAELWLWTPQAGLRLMHRFADNTTRSLAGSCF